MCARTLVERGRPVDSRARGTCRAPAPCTSDALSRGLLGGTASAVSPRNPSPKDPSQLCDTLANVSEQGLAEHKDTAVHAILTFAQTTATVSGTDKGSTTATKASDWKGDKLVR
jgi:hypothetical protein